MLERLQVAVSDTVKERVVAPLRRRLPVSGAAGGAVDWIAERLERPTITALKLKFAMDRTDDEQHAVWVYRVDEEGEVLVEDVRQLLRFGYREERKIGDNRVINVLSEKDQQTLLALKSLNPQIGEDGELLFDFAPPIFDYLRHKENTVESKRSRQLQISDEPPRPRAVVDFEPDAGVLVKTGYSIPGQKQLAAHETLPRTKDGQYTLLDDTFYPLQEQVDPEVQPWLSKTTHRRSLNQTPSFFTTELPKLRESMFDVELDQAARKVRVRERSLKPTAIVDFDPGSGYEIEAGYKLPGDENLTPSGRLQQTPDGQYAILDNDFFPLSPTNSSVGRELLEKGRLHVPLQDVPEFFVRDLALIRNDFNAVLTDLARQVNVVDHAFSPMVKVDRKERGWLDFNVGYEINGEFVPHTLFTRSSGDGHQRVNDTTWVRPDAGTISETQRRLENLGADEEGNGYRVPVAQFASLESFIDAIGGQAELSANYEMFLEQLTGFEADENYRLPELTESLLRRQDIKLRPYQRAGIHWLEWLHENHLHGVLADDMGLGKTLQSIMVLRRAYEKSRSRQPSLVVCPKSVMTHWEREVHRFFPHMRVERYHGPTRYRLRRRLSNSLQPILLVSTYATVRNDVEHLSKVPFFYLILDEATAIKNPSAKQTKAMKALNAAHRLALSGTPVENRPNGLWSMFDFLMRNHLGTQTQFERRYEGPISNGNQRAAEQLALRVRPFLLRRKKEDVARDLPEKIEFDEWCELTREQRQLYGSVQGEAKRMWHALRRGDDVEYPHILSVLQYLKRICDHPAIVTEKWEPLMKRSEKFDWIVDKVDEILRQGEQVAIFSHYLDMLDLLQKVMQRRKWRYIRIDGSTNRRQALVDKFNRGEAVVALLSLRAAGQGITLTGANHVIHADRWWNPAVEDQATDRVHRIGQDKTVYVYRILVSNTLEERIDELLTEKRGIADRIIGAATDGARKWSREELVEILRPFE